LKKQNKETISGKDTRALTAPARALSQLEEFKKGSSFFTLE
jgi:hypothetical protein